MEVAIGTGRNLPFYPRGIQLTGIDFSPAMLEIARGRAAELGVDVTLIEADAQHLPFADHRFDTVVCTLALSSIPDPAAAINEMHRVLRPGGQLLVVGHVASPHRVVRAGQRTLERLSIRLAGDHQTRRPTQKSSLLASPLIDVNASGRASSNASTRSSRAIGEQPSLNIFRHTARHHQRRARRGIHRRSTHRDTTAKGVGSAFYRIDLGLSGESFPGLESANEIGGAFDAELAQRRGRQARAVPSSQTMIMRRFALSASATWCGQLGSSRHSKTLRSMINAPGSSHHAAVARSGGYQ